MTLYVMGEWEKGVTSSYQGLPLGVCMCMVDTLCPLSVLCYSVVRVCPYVVVLAGNVYTA